jgi:DNA methylase
MHDDILFSAKSITRPFNIEYEAPSESYVKRFGGRTQFLDPETKTRKITIDEDAKGLPCRDVWNLSIIASVDKERIGYPTQKPETLLERFIKASGNEGDIVADFFCGSGTTAAVAEKLGRKWIATNLGKSGIHTMRKSLIGVQRELKAADKNFRVFEVWNLGRYERQAYLNVSGRLTGKQKAEALAVKERDFRELILRAYNVEPLQNEPFFHGKNVGRLVAVGPINLPVGRLFVEEVITECRNFDYMSRKEMIKVARGRDWRARYATRMWRKVSRPISRRDGLAATFSKTNGKAFARAKTVNSNLPAWSTATKCRGAIRSR